MRDGACLGPDGGWVAKSGEEGSGGSPALLGVAVSVLPCGLRVLRQQIASARGTPMGLPRVAG